MHCAVGLWPHITIISSVATHRSKAALRFSIKSDDPESSLDTLIFVIPEICENSEYQKLIHVNVCQWNDNHW
jgi:hypothetical protein